MERIKNWVTENPDLSFAILLAVTVYTFFAITEPLFFTHRTGFAIMERFAVPGLVGLALTLCIIAGEIDLSIGSNAALAAVITVRFTDDWGRSTHCWWRWRFRRPSGLFRGTSSLTCAYARVF